VNHTRICRNPLMAFTLLALLAAGCSYTAVPRTVPSLGNSETPSLTGVQVLVVNGEKDATLSAVPGSDRENSYFKANRQAWSRMLVESLARELARRGALVRPTAPLTLSIAVPEITFVETRDVYQFRVKAAVTSSRGWSKEYSGIAGVSASSVFSIEKEADRLAGQVLANLIREMLGDAEFLSQLKAS